ETLRFILIKNIVWGDALTLKYADGSGMPIVFSEWSLVMGNMFKRRDFYFSNLVNSEFNGVFDSSDTGDTKWSPVPVREFPLCDYKRLKDAE
ncbi:MAG TPA: restriction endonuclease subunit M, partial [Alphaproteobacteria bacterium]|nr:restriction endonuclease subunit M [Alphaproteobacteria bacterium]